MNEPLPVKKTGISSLRAWLKILACLLIYLGVFLADEYCMNHGLVAVWKGVAFLLIFTFCAFAVCLIATFIRHPAP